MSFHKCKRTTAVILGGMLCMAAAPGMSEPAGVEAIAIQSGETKEGSISSPGAFDTYGFQAQDGDTIIALAGTLSSALDPQLELYAPDGSIVGEPVRGGYSARIHTTLAQCRWRPVQAHAPSVSLPDRPRPGTCGGRPSPRCVAATHPLAYRHP